MGGHEVSASLRGPSADGPPRFVRHLTDTAELSGIACWQATCSADADYVDFEGDPDSHFFKRERGIRMSKHLHPDMVQIYRLVWWKVFEL